MNLKTKSVQPLSDRSLYAAGGAYAATTPAECAANYPALKHYLPLTEQEGLYYGLESPSNTNWVTDVAGGVIPRILLGGFTNINGVISFSQEGFANRDLGANWTPPGNKKVVVLFVGKPEVGCSMPFGMGYVTNRIYITLGASSPNLSRYVETTTFAVAPAMTNRTVDGTYRGYALSAEVGSANGLRLYDYDGVTFNSTSYVDMTAVNGIAEFDSNYDSNICDSHANPANIQVWHFDTMPSQTEIKAAVAWTFAMVSTPPYTKAVYPGWKGRT